MLELVGLPGSGKSTLAAALVNREPGRFVLAKPGHATMHGIAHAALCSLLPFGSQLLKVHNATWKRYTQLVQLEAVRQVVQRHSREHPDGITILDQGPVYLLSLIQGLHAPDGRENAGRFAMFWQRALETWGGHLDLVVELDVPDGELLRRIRARGKQHRVQSSSDDESIRYFRAARDRRKRIIESLQRTGRDVKYGRIQSHRRSIDEVADDLLTLLASFQERR